MPRSCDNINAVIGLADWSRVDRLDRGGATCLHHAACLRMQTDPSIGMGGVRLAGRPGRSPALVDRLRPETPETPETPQTQH